MVVPELAGLLVQAAHRGLERCHPLPARGQSSADRCGHDRLSDSGVCARDEDAAQLGGVAEAVEDLHVRNGARPDPHARAQHPRGLAQL